MKWLLNLMLNSFLFFPEKDFYEFPQNYGLVAEEVSLVTPGGFRLHGWFFKGSSTKPILLFFHGNAGNISGRLLKAKGWVERGVSVFLVDYRGYGKSEGKIQKGADLLADAETALRWLEENKKVSSNQIILYGESIGSYPATSLAREKKFAGLVLEAPFTTLNELAKKHYGGVPDSALGDFQMNNDAAIPKAQAPVFVLHGDQDEICPKEMGERLYELAPSPKEFYVVQEGAHNNLLQVAGSRYFDYPYEFLARENKFS